MENNTENVFLNKFNNGKVYKIVSPEYNKFYIGSTTDELEARLYSHQSQYKFHQKGNGNYVSSFDVIKYPNCYIKLIEAVNCETREELHKVEGKYQKMFNDQIVNKNKAGRTPEDVKKYLIEYQKNHYDEHQVALKKSYYQPYKCCCGLEISRGNRTHHIKSKIHSKILNEISNKIILEISI